jgi:hypothetical protein
MGMFEAPRRKALGTSAWQRARKRALQRDGYVCQACGAPAVIGGHRVAPERGGDNLALANIVALCRACNVSQASEDFDTWLQRPFGRPAMIRAAKAGKAAPRRPRYPSAPLGPPVAGDPETHRFTFPVHLHRGMTLIGDYGFGRWPADGTCPPSCTLSW